jgi:hypothetical protein
VAVIVVQLWIATRVSGTPGAHVVGTLAGTPSGDPILPVLRCFTLHSNILSGLSSMTAHRC